VTRFYASRLSDGSWHAVYTVPAGKRIKVSDLQMTNVSGPSGTGGLAVDYGSGLRVVTYLGLSGAPYSGRLTLGAVFNAGDVLYVSGLASNLVDVLVSGYTYFV
jgi:hypothetical protein